MGGGGASTPGFFTAAAAPASVFSAIAIVIATTGATEKIKRGNDAHLRQLAKKSTHVRFFL
jgi:hypothetical protein